MSNIYIQEPPTHGKVCLETSVGDIEIELWARECPKACRNFVQLCMENYYNKTKFHRVVKDFIVQGGDPTATGEGGESIYGQPFRDEFHSRLRFVRRGLVAMANAGKDDNGSQFFFTMGPTQELQNKHTLFGKVVGDTIYNMIKLQEVETDPNDRPVVPHKILRTKVLINPFPDIEPRKVIQMDDLDDEARKKKKPKSKMKATKDYKLLSFGEEAEDDEENLDSVQKTFASKPKSSHDLLNDPKLSKDVGLSDKKITNEDEDEQLDGDRAAKTSEKDDRESEVANEVTADSVREKLKKAKSAKSALRSPERKKAKYDEDQSDNSDREEDSEAKKRADIKRQIRALKKEMLYDGKDKSDEADSKNGTAGGKGDKKGRKAVVLSEEDRSNDMLANFHKEQEKYASKKTVPKKGSAREAMTMALLSKFKSKLENVKTDEPPTASESSSADKRNDDEEEEELNSSDNWMANTLKFESNDPVLAKDASTKDDDWFDIYDPRNPMNKRRRQNDAKSSDRKK